MYTNIVINEMKLIFKDTPYGIEHTLRVVSNAELIMYGETVQNEVQETVILAAILHDIGAIEAQKKYGSLEGYFQEIEGPIIARSILERAGVPQKAIERICYIIGNHHTFSKIDGMDFQILWEADILDSLEFGEPATENGQLNLKIKENFKTTTGYNLALTRLILNNKISHSPDLSNGDGE